MLVAYYSRGCDSKRSEAFIPNKEIIGEFENSMSIGGWPWQVLEPPWQARGFSLEY